MSMLTTKLLIYPAPAYAAYISNFHTDLSIDALLNLTETLYREICFDSILYTGTDFLLNDKFE